MPIPTNITYRSMSSSDAVESAILDWVDKLETVFDRCTRCEVVVEAPHRRHRQGQQYHVRITLHLPGGHLTVSRDPGRLGAHEDIYVAIRDAFHALRRQLEDHVRKNLRVDVKNHVEPSHGRITYLDVERAWGYLETDSGRRVYFHRNSVVGDIDRLAVGDEVRYAEEAGIEGPQASSVVPLGSHGHHALPAT